MTASATAPRILRIMPREMRLMSERILSLTAMPRGFSPVLCDIVMYSQGLGLGGFADLEAGIEALKAADPSKLTLQGAILDAHGQHAWVVLPSALDLLGDGVTPLEIRNVAEPGELAVAAAYGARLGLEVTVEGTTLSARRVPASDPLLDRLLTDGTPISEDLWWRIWALAQTALAPDTDVSRRHAGAVIVMPDGTVIGRKDNDDETDPGFMLATAKAGKELTT